MNEGSDLHEAMISTSVGEEGSDSSSRIGDGERGTSIRVEGIIMGETSGGRVGEYTGDSGKVRSATSGRDGQLRASMMSGSTE